MSSSLEREGSKSGKKLKSIKIGQLMLNTVTKGLFL